MQPIQVQYIYIGHQPLQRLQGVLMHGMTPDATLWVDELDFDADADTLWRHSLRYTGQWPPMLASSDERDTEQLPADLMAPEQPSATHPLHKAPTRLRGLRETDRLSDWLHTLTISEKMALMPHLEAKNVPFTPMQWRGISESTVLSSATLTPDVSVVIRRVALAYTLPAIQIDSYGLTYAYDSSILHLAHMHQANSDDAPLLTPEHLTAFGDAAMQQPVDCLAHGGYLYIADDGAGERLNRLHIWRIGETP